MKRFAAVAIAAALLVPPPAAAQGPATIRGVVYDCANGTPIGGAAVELRNLDDGWTTRFVVGKDGRFARVGVEPGRYLISAKGPVVGGLPGMTLPSQTASRLARMESDDVLDVRIGTYPTLYRAAVERSRGSQSVAAPAVPAADMPQPVCDPPYVRPAPPTANRYIIH